MRISKRALAFFLTVIMIISMVPSTVFAVDNVICRHTCFKQIISEDRKQQIRFTAAAHSGNHLNESIVLLADQLFQIIISPDFQRPRLH